MKHTKFDMLQLLFLIIPRLGKASIIKPINYLLWHWSIISTSKKIASYIKQQKRKLIYLKKVWNLITNKVTINKCNTSWIFFYKLLNYFKILNFIAFLSNHFSHLLQQSNIGFYKVLIQNKIIPMHNNPHFKYPS